MDPQIVSPSQHHDNDADLSFEALTFGEDSSHVKKDSKLAKKKSFKKEKHSPQQEEKTTSQAAAGGHNGVAGTNSAVTPSSTTGVASTASSSSPSVYISTKDEAGRMDVQSLLKRLEQFGIVKASYFKEKQNFGFVQFLDASVADVVVDVINKNPCFLGDGVNLTASVERGHGKGTAQSLGASLAGTSLGTSFGGIPFSPSTPTPSMPPSFVTSPSGQSSAPATPTTVTSPVIEKPDTILVLKNLPFSLKQDQLQEILMAVNTTAPQSINLHFDNMGVFRGMAFIKYRLLDDAIKVYEALNGYDVGGRKVRVEYKRKNKGQQADIPAEWQEEEDLKKLWEQVRDFSTNATMSEISFTPNLTSNQRKHIHAMAEKLKLTHYSNGEGDLRYICIKKSAPSPAPTATAPSSFGSVSSLSVPSNQNGFALPLPTADARAIDIKGRRPRRDSENNGLRHTLSSSPNGNHNGSLPVGSVEKEYRPRGNSAYKKDFGSMPSDISDWRVQSPRDSQQAQLLAQSPSVVGGIVIAPSRQPKGPDGSKGFNDLYKNARKNACTFVPFTDNAPEIPAIV